MTKARELSVDADGSIILPRASSNPVSGAQGSMYYNTTDKHLYIHDGSSWIDVSADYKLLTQRDFSFIQSVAEWGVGTEEIFRYELPASTQLVIQQIGFYKKGGGTTDTDVKLVVKDDTPSTLTTTNLNSTATTTVNSGTAATITIEIQNTKVTAENACILILGRIIPV